MLTQLREDISCILERDPAARSRLEILTCYPGLHAVTLHRASHYLWNKNWLWLARFISHLTRILTAIEIHPGAQLGRRVFIDHGFGVVIGETAIVGDDCTIYQGVTLGGTRLYKGEKRHPTLERGVVVGAGAQILGGFSVGEYARVGSNAVVVKPVPAHATAVGNPARIMVKEDSTGSQHRPSPDTAPHDLAATVPPSNQDEQISEPDTTGDIPASSRPVTGDPAVPASSRPTSAPTAPLYSTESADVPCQQRWSGRSLHDILNTGGDPETETSSEFAAYAVESNGDDPLTHALQELIEHAACQEQRIDRLCKAMEDLGQRIDNGDVHLDKERLKRLLR